MGHPRRSSLGLPNYEKMLVVMQGLETETVHRRVTETQTWPQHCRMLLEMSLQTPLAEALHPLSHIQCVTHPDAEDFLLLLTTHGIKAHWIQGCLHITDSSLELMIWGSLFYSHAWEVKPEKQDNWGAKPRILNQNAGQVWEPGLSGTNCPSVTAGTPVSMQPCEWE